jgi:hypothetical protein
MLLYAANDGFNIDVCNLAISWGADCFDCVLYGAAYRGNIPMCYKAREWGARDFERALLYAKRGCHKETIELCEQWLIN